MSGEKIGPEEKFSVIENGIIENGYPAKLWESVKTFALSYLRKGRPDFDVPHTKAVVYWVYRLATDYNEKVRAGDIGGEMVDSVVLITAAWLHDIGYYGEFNDVASLGQISSKKERHMIVGAEMADKFLHERAFDILSEGQIKQIVHLVRVHDNLEETKTMPETILLEADTLGAMDTDWVKPTFRGREAWDYLNRERTRKRWNMFRTPLGKESLKKVVDRFKQFAFAS